MQSFANLLDRLILTPSRNRKLALLGRYFASTADPHRGYGLAALTGNLSIANLKPALLRGLIAERVDPQLFALSYDYVGDLAETIALMWPSSPTADTDLLPDLGDIIALLNATSKGDMPGVVADLLDRGDANARWALIKLVTGGLRVGVSARLAKTALASLSDAVSLDDIEAIWHGLEPPYQPLFDWLEGRSGAPEIDPREIFHPMMLAHPLDEDKDPARLDISDFAAEWKWDGIRVQIALHDSGVRLFSRTGDEISHSFPDLVESLRGTGVLDGELLVGKDGVPDDFNALQQRLGRKRVLKKHLQDHPAFVRVYDLLFDGTTDIRTLAFDDRRKRLEKWVAANPQPKVFLSEQLSANSWEKLANLRHQGTEEQGYEGVMLKRRQSAYVSGRPKGEWFKWKREPRTVDAVILYAQRGHGRRSSFYSDFTFGVWDGNALVPIGKAYSGFTDAELKKLDHFVRANTIARFGPVREVTKKLVVEVAFDSAHESRRHKSGVALRFPRFSRIRWDKPVDEVEDIAAFRRQFVC